MGYYKIGKSVLVSLLMVLSASFVPSLPMLLMTSPVLAQTVDARKAEADRLIEQGAKQIQVKQFNAALQSWKQALHIYREIKDRKGEGMALRNFGNVYSFLKDYPKAIEYLQQRLKIAREIKNHESEGKSIEHLRNDYNN